MRVPTLLSTLCTGRRGPSIQSGSRSVPRVSGLRPRPGRWESLEIPVGLAFFFRNSLLDKYIVFYPGPAGATESELPIDSFETVLAENPGLSQMRADVEALIVSVPTSGQSPRCFVVPIDACYELVGRLRTVWRGFDGGQDAARAVDEFFGRVEARSRSA